MSSFLFFFLPTMLGWTDFAHLFIADGVVYQAKYAGHVFKKQGFGNLIITASISAHIVNVPIDQPVSSISIFPLSAKKKPYTPSP